MRLLQQLMFLALSTVKPQHGCYLANLTDTVACIQSVCLNHLIDL